METEGLGPMIKVKEHKHPKKVMHSIIHNFHMHNAYENMRCIHSRKFYIGRSNNKVDSIETGRIVIAPLLP